MTLGLPKLNCGCGGLNDGMMIGEDNSTYKQLTVTSHFWHHVWMLLAEYSESISHSHTAHIKKCPDSIVGKRQRPQLSLLNLFIRHRHGLRHMAFSITISTQCHISVLSDTKFITWISLPVCGKQLISVFVVCAWVCPSLSIYVIRFRGTRTEAVSYTPKLFIAATLSLLFSLIFSHDLAPAPRSAPSSSLFSHLCE